MFIEQLTKEQLCEFFKTKHLSCSMTSSAYDEDYLFVSIDGDSMCINYRLHDFEGSTVKSETEWRKFMYKIFGEDYKKEYRKFLQREMEEKLSCLVETI